MVPNLYTLMFRFWTVEYHVRFVDQLISLYVCVHLSLKCHVRIVRYLEYKSIKIQKCENLERESGCGYHICVLMRFQSHSNPNPIPICGLSHKKQKDYALFVLFYTTTVYTCGFTLINVS